VARTFNGTTDDLTSTTLPVTATPFTLSIWFRLTVDVDAATISLGQEGQSNHRWTLYLESSGNLLRLQARTTTTSSLSPGNTWTVNQWHHALGVCANDTDRTVYLDGDVVNKGTQAVEKLVNVPDVITIGRLPNDTDAMTGDLAHGAVWDVALGDDDARTLAAGVSPLRVRPGNLVFFVPILGVSPEPDFTATGANLTVNGTTLADDPPVGAAFAYDEQIGLFVPVGGAAPPATPQTIVEITHTFA
jgi:hypothetical protein